MRKTDPTLSSLLNSKQEEVQVESGCETDGRYSLEPMSMRMSDDDQQNSVQGTMMVQIIDRGLQRRMTQTFAIRRNQYVQWKKIKLLRVTTTSTTSTNERVERGGIHGVGGGRYDGGAAQRFYRGQIRLAVEAQLCVCTARAPRHSVESFRPPPPAYEASVRPGDGVDKMMMRQV